MSDNKSPFLNYHHIKIYDGASVNRATEHISVEELYQAFKERMIKEIAIDPEQAIRDKLDSHNDKLRDNQPPKGTTLQAN